MRTGIMFMASSILFMKYTHIGASHARIIHGARVCAEICTAYVGKMASRLKVVLGAMELGRRKLVEDQAVRLTSPTRHVIHSAIVS